MAIYNETLSPIVEMVSTGNDPAALRVVPYTISELLGFGSQFGTSLTVSLDEIFEMGDLIEEQIGVVVYELMLMQDEIYLGGSSYSARLNDAMWVKSVVRISTLVIINESLNIIHTSEDAKLFFSVLTELLYVTGVAENRLEAANLVLAGISIADIYSNIAPELLSETLSVSLIQSILADQKEALNEIMEVLHSYSTTVSFFSVIEEDFDLSAFSSLGKILNVLQEESVIFATSFYEPLDIEAYILNPENTVISNYSNFSFTAACEFMKNYLFCNPTGLFLHEGTTDTGSFITSKIKTPSMDFGTSNKKQMPQIYLGVDNDSKLIMRASIDGRNTAYYQLNLESQNLDTQYIKLGKGLVGRYWQFELSTKENEGLDIDTIEFYPITFGRKR